MSIGVINNRVRGCIVGGALGDAVGLFTEFMSSGEARQHYGDNPKFKLRPPAPAGYKTMHMDRHRGIFDEAGWTDDTDQSLLILMSLLRSGKNLNGIDYLDFAARLKFWVQYGFRPLNRLPLGLGRTVGSVVRNEKYLDDPLARSTEVWENGGRVMAANGALMRTPVVGALIYDNQDALYSTAINIAATTHADPRCLASCTIASSLVAAMIREEIHSEDDIRKVVELALEPVKKHDPPILDDHIKELQDIIWKDTLDDIDLDGRSAIGYTLKCLAAGVWGLRQGLKALNESPSNGSILRQQFEKVITDLTMAGGDADTNAAVAGSLLGTLFGYSNLPPEWTQDLKDCEWLVSKADAATYLATRQGAPYTPDNDPDNLIDGGKGEMSREELDAKWMAQMETMHRRTGDFEKFEELKKKGNKQSDQCIIT
ncbi:ADP-ribosylglycohydrolase [Serendipita vermifera]|nr:ADP-ribosylglycohydrolase [Serendipita vermifera]